VPDLIGWILWVEVNSSCGSWNDNANNGFVEKVVGRNDNKPKWSQIPVEEMNSDDGETKCPSRPKYCDDDPLFELKDVSYIKEYKRRYQQTKYMCEKTDWSLIGGGTDSPVLGITTSKKCRTYYMKPRWTKPGGCHCPVVSLCHQSYFNGAEFEDEQWSTDDEEGVRIYYVDGPGQGSTQVRVENMKDGKRVGKNEVVKPYVGIIPKSDNVCTHGTGVAVANRERFATQYDSTDEENIDPYYSPKSTVNRRKKAAHDSRARRKKKAKLAKVKRELVCDFCPTMEAEKKADEEARDIKQYYDDIDDEAEAGGPPWNQTESNEENNWCGLCYSTPCVWQQNFHWINLFCEVEWPDHGSTSPLTNAEAKRRRFRLYCQLALRLYGPLRAGDRRKHPKCIENGIRGRYPDSNGVFVGFTAS